MALPQRLTFVTLGARDLPKLRSFYRGIGWVENGGGSDTYSSFDCGSVKLVLYPVDLLRDEAAPECEPPGPGHWNGFTLAINFASADEVDIAYEAAILRGRLTGGSALEGGVGRVLRVLRRPGREPLGAGVGPGI